MKQVLDDAFIGEQIALLPDDLAFVTPYFAFARAIEAAVLASIVPTVDAKPGRHFVMFDDGSKVEIDSWTGGAHELGSFGGLTLLFTDSEGHTTRREYHAHPSAAKDAPDKT